MTSKFVFMPHFERAIKRLKKRYRNIIGDVEKALGSLRLNQLPVRSYPMIMPFTKYGLLGVTCSEGKAVAIDCCIACQSLQTKI